MAGLKPNEEIMTSAAVLAVVYGIFEMQAPNLADVRASKPNGPAAANVHTSVKGAAWEATAVVAGISLLAKSPTIFVVGGLATSALAWHYYHANTVNPATNKSAAGAMAGGGTMDQS